MLKVSKYFEEMWTIKMLIELWTKKHREEEKRNLKYKIKFAVTLSDDVEMTKMNAYWCSRCHCCSCSGSCCIIQKQVNAAAATACRDQDHITSQQNKADADAKNKIATAVVAFFCFWIIRQQAAAAAALMILMLLVLELLLMLLMMRYTKYKWEKNNC